MFCALFRVSVYVPEPPLIPYLNNVRSEERRLVKKPELHPTPGLLNSMDSAPFRDFLSANSYASREAFLSEAANGGGATSEFVKWFLEIRKESRTRRHLGDFRQQWGRGDRGFKVARWYNVFCQEVFNLWRLMHQRCVPMAARPVEEALGKSRADRRAGARQGACKYSVPSIEYQAGIVAGRVWDALGSGQWMAWYDNFYRRRFCPSPHDNNVSLNCTAVTILKLANVIPPFVSFPTLDDLVDSFPSMASRLVTSHSSLCRSVADIMSEAIDAHHIRCPLDMRRMGVTSVQWQPFLLSPKETGRQDDLVCLLKLMSELQQRTERVFPFVVDEQIHYRIMKLLYSTSYSKWKVNTWLIRTPPIYGVWHPYKYSLTLCYRRFFPIMVFLSNGRLSPGDIVPSFPKIIWMERMFACLLVLAHRLKGCMDVKKQDVAKWPKPLDRPPQRIYDNIHALYSLLYEYTPALFLLGCLVRDCNWGSADSGTALKVLEYSLHVIQHLCLGSESKVEYVRSLSSALMIWSSWYSNLPGHAHSEEMCEALLSRLVQKLRFHPQCKTLDGACELFLLLCPASKNPKDLKDGKMQADLVPYVDSNLNALVNCLYLPPPHFVPFCKWTSNKKSPVSNEWEASYRYPVPLSTPITEDHFTDLLKHVLGTVCGPVILKDATINALNTFVPLKSVPQKQAHDLAVRAIRSNMPVRFKRQKDMALSAPERRPERSVAKPKPKAAKPPAVPKPRAPKQQAAKPPAAKPPPAPKPQALSPFGPSMANIAVDVDASDIDSNASGENYLYEGDDYHSQSDVSVHSDASSLPVPLLEEDELVDLQD